MLHPILQLWFAISFSFLFFLIFIWLHGVLVEGSSLWHVGSFVAERGLFLAAHGLLCSCGARAQLTRGMWDLSSPTRD